MPIRVIALVFVCVSLASAQPMLPTTPAGRVLTAWLSAFNSGDLAALQAFDATHRPDAPPVSFTQRLRSDTGGFTLVRIEKSTPTTITALLEENDARRLARLELEVTDDAKPIVVSSTLRIVARTADIPLARLTEAQTISALTAKMDDQLKEDRFSGAVLIGHRGRIVFQKAVGLANRESRTPNTLDTQFRNGSMNKMFTATAVMQLVEAGKLSLDDTVGKVMTDYPNADVARKVTIRHLLGHTGGTGDFFGPEFMKNRLTLKTHADYVAMFGGRAPLHEPGAEFRYSNYGMMLLGAIIERVSGLSYFDYVRTKVFEPAGMTSTGSLPETDTVPNRSTGYMRTQRRVGAEYRHVAVERNGRGWRLLDGRRLLPIRRRVAVGEAGFESVADADDHAWHQPPVRIRHVPHRRGCDAQLRPCRRRAGAERRSQGVPGIRLRDCRAQQPRSAGRVEDG